MKAKERGRILILCTQLKDADVRRIVDLGRIHIYHLVALFVLNDRKFPCALYNPVSVSYNLKPNPRQCVLCVFEPYNHSVPPYLTGLRITPYFRVKA
jgi:hypothetical protein